MVVIMKLRALLVLAALCCVLPAVTNAASAVTPGSVAASAPTISGVSPAVGRRAGGNAVTITGSGLSTLTKVQFGTNTATGVTHVSSTILRVTAPAHASGTVGVRVTGPGGTSANASVARYTYVELSPHLTWSAASAVPGVAGRTLSDVSCASDQHCVAVTTDGYAYTYTGGWSAPVAAIPDGRADAVSCPSTTFCVAVGRATNGDIRAAVFSGGRWRAPTVIEEGQQVWGVSCSSSRLCQVAVTHEADGYAVAYRSDTWTAPELLTTGDTALTGVACPSDTYCLATSESGAGFAYDGSSWSPVDTHYPGGTAAPARVVCATRNYCVLASDFPWIGTGVAWGQGLTGSASDGSASDVSCGATTFCVVTTEGEDAAPATYAFNGAAASDTPNPLPSGSISCPSSQECVVVKGTQVTIAHRAP